MQVGRVKVQGAEILMKLIDEALDGLIRVTSQKSFSQTRIFFVWLLKMINVK